MTINYLRVSVTDRCNLRCVYCSPLGGCDLIDRSEILTFEQIHRIVTAFAHCGITKVRLTGGEPLIRRNILSLIDQLSRISAIEEISLTTNGTVLERMAEQLKSAGLKSVNISIDSVDRENFLQITGSDLLSNVIRGIQQAVKVGLNPVKINSVILKSINFSQILSLAKMSINMPLAVRFIEYCPTTRYTKPSSESVPGHVVRSVIEKRFGRLLPVITSGANGPARYFKIKNSAGLIGFISGISTDFCSECNRLRLTSDGKIKPCLYSFQTYDFKKIVRNKTSANQLEFFAKQIIDEKRSFTKHNCCTHDFIMSQVGG